MTRCRPLPPSQLKASDAAWPVVLLTLAGLCALLVAMVGPVFASTAGAATPGTFSSRTIVQPGPLKTGPGSERYRHADWRVSEGGNGYDAWHVFEPVQPRPARAPLVVISHGYGEFTGYSRLFELIRHTVLKGNVVIFPRWQTGEFVPCPGPFNIAACMDAAVRGIHGGIEYLQASSGRVQPRLGRTSYYGYSFGGIITANIASQYRRYRIPRPKAIFLDDPHDGEVAGLGEPALDDSLAGIPANVRFVCHSGADGVIGVPRLREGSCNAVFPKISHIPPRDRALVMTRDDSWGVPALSSGHGVCAAEPGNSNAFDWRFCRRNWDALRSCANQGRNCQVALGTGRAHRWLGRWSDGRPVRQLVVQKRAPLTP